MRLQGLSCAPTALATCEQSTGEAESVGQGYCHSTDEADLGEQPWKPDASWAQVAAGLCERLVQVQWG
jgi:hypothetical protein